MEVSNIKYTTPLNFQEDSEEMDGAEVVDDIVNEANNIMNTLQDPTAAEDIKKTKLIGDLAKVLEQVGGEDGKLFGDMLQLGYDSYSTCTQIAEALLTSKPSLDPAALVNVMVTTPQVATNALRRAFPALRTDLITLEAENTVIKGVTTGSSIACGSVLLVGSILAGPLAPAVWATAAAATMLGAGVGAGYGAYNFKPSDKAMAELERKRTEAVNKAKAAMTPEQRIAIVAEALAAAFEDESTPQG